ncbi:MAG: hypothetical protein EON86_13885 [Brevundimonas sp.]|nr:MAG: hypothetical protein EON86_13885 [Brevundimonas sp.]
MDWARIEPLFDWDGSWRDIYVLGTSAEDWRNALDAIRRECPNAMLRSADPALSPTPIPDPAPDVRDMIGQGALLVIDLNGIRVNCHFFDEAEIEFDIDPREIIGLEQVARLLEFMAILGKATGKPVLLTPENGRDFTLCRWDAGAISFNYA